MPDPWITELAKQLPADAAPRSIAKPQVDLDALVAQGNAAQDKANQLDAQFRDLYARLTTKKAG